METILKKYAKPWELVVLTVSLLVLVELVFVMQLQAGHFAGDPVLRVAAPENEWLAGELTPHGIGFEKELLDKFCNQNNLRWTWIRTKNWAEAWEQVRKGRADIVIGLGTEPPTSLEVKVTAGPSYARTRPVLVHNNKRLGVSKDCDIFDRPVLVTADTGMTDSLRQKADELDCTSRTVSSADMSMTPLLDTLSRNQARFALVDERRFALWQPFYRKIKAAKTLDRELDYRWYWSERSSILAGSLQHFWTEIQANGQLANLYDKYFGFLPEETDYFELYHLIKTVEEKLPRYRKAILKAAERTGVDPLLLVAVIYQESRFESAARSKTGVRGLMQITTATARTLGVNRMDPFESISGGSRYLQRLYNGLDDMGLDTDTRWLFALASYNRGPGHLRDATDLAKRLGGTGKSWRELKTVFPKLCYERYYKDSRYGYTKGYEVVHYVERIRYYHYILHGLVILSRPEAQELTALVSASSGSVL
ncbi:transglycosylase SLT domain-containing protein [Desulfovibrio ferrophilus]|uniref:Transglycosylase, Slt family n=1 Tax=Desulfovibrio ferrophilus TaxID=241368 RepID=A0A2Z6B1G8_9BACT|nr:transglycosylase SLT domain-containing protein [Desulfovibrio ferrophilus]BBD09334.1 transglycosylase, Slt family [Desulfovibrio ferrophilus]